MRELGLSGDVNWRPRPCTSSGVGAGRQGKPLRMQVMQEMGMEDVAFLLLRSICKGFMS